MDLKTSYWQIELDERDREKTAFINPEGLYEFEGKSFGLCMARATFERAIDTVLAGLKWHNCLVYLEDFVAFSRPFDEHLARLQSVLESIGTSGLTLKSENYSHLPIA